MNKCTHVSNNYNIQFFKIKFQNNIRPIASLFLFLSFLFVCLFFFVVVCFCLFVVVFCFCFFVFLFFCFCFCCCCFCLFFCFLLLFFLCFFLCFFFQIIALLPILHLFFPYIHNSNIVIHAKAKKLTQR